MKCRPQYNHRHPLLLSHLQELNAPRRQCRSSWLHPHVLEGVGGHQGESGHVGQNVGQRCPGGVVLCGWLLP